ncbi:head maturation protease [Haloarcula hispanica tailed virus 2]|uniref:Prohead protease n=1 Tax=Haloarcula hispanica tailed virus 2 TaxID=1273751 RepID=R4TM12_9CAUD|nr:head maturation protease [Haloarcula hispanica tailed virus 2]AGM11203.1 prohead protease [Haloarcula hispanica tailed virus 2]
MTEPSGDVQKPVGPFEDFEACVRHFEGDPDVDDPQALCGWMEENKDLAQEYDPDDGGVLDFVEALKEPQAEKVLTNLSVTFVSGVENPAIDSQWVYAKDADTERDGADWGVQAPIVLHTSKTVVTESGARAPVWAAEKDGEDGEEQKAWAPVLIPNETDKQGDVIPSDEIESAAHEFLAEYRQIDTDHDLFDGKGVPIESWTLKEAQTFTAPDGSESREYPAGTWMMGVQFSDEAWKRVKEGELTGFSIYGEATQIDVEDFLGGNVSPEEAEQASAATAAALAAKGVSTGAEERHMSEEDNDPDETEKQVPAEGVDLIVGSIESYIASNDADLSTSIEEWLEWAVSAEGDWDVSELMVAGQEFTGGGGEDTEEPSDEGGEDGGPETEGGPDEPPAEEQQMSESNKDEGGEDPPTDDGEQADEEPSLKEMVSSVKGTVEETRDTVKSVQDRVDDLEAEVFGKDEGGDGDGAEPEATPQEDLEDAVEQKMADILGVAKSDLPEDPEERNEVIRKHIHENRTPGDEAADPDSWTDDDFAELTGAN